MRDYMSYLLGAFLQAGGGNDFDNGYQHLQSTVNELLGFETPRGLRLTLSRANLSFANSYQLRTVGAVDGSISYLYSTLPLPDIASRSSERVALPSCLQSWRDLTELHPSANTSVPAGQGSGADKVQEKAPAEKKPTKKRRKERSFQAKLEWRLDDPEPEPDETKPSQVASSSAETTTFLQTSATMPSAPDSKATINTSHPDHTLLYGRLYLPKSELEALVARRLMRDRLLVKLVAVSQSELRRGGTLLGSAFYDAGRYGVEGLLSSDSGLIGARGVYSFGGDAPPFLGRKEHGEERTLGGEPGPASSVGTATSFLPATTLSDVPSPAYESGPSPGSTASPNTNSSAPSPADRERIYGRCSLGGEVYYGLLNKSGGLSVAARFQTLPTYRGTPLTTTVTLTPLMGSVSASYAVVARGGDCTLGTRLGFNVYSYESDWAVGVELWSRKRPVAHGVVPEVVEVGVSGDGVVTPGQGGEPTAAVLVVKDENSPVASDMQILQVEKSSPMVLAEPAHEQAPELAPASTNKEDNSKIHDIEKPEKKDEYLGVLKARLDQHLRIGLMWEGRFKSLLFSLGSDIDLRKPEAPFRSVGLEVQFSS